jgi:hypothetical protein
MAMPEDFKNINLFVIEEIQKARNFPPGPQYADDPLRLLKVMQSVKMQFSNAELSDDQARRLYEYFQEEAKNYRQQYHQYFRPTGAHDDVLKDIEAMLGHLKKRGA